MSLATILSERLGDRIIEQNTTADGILCLEIAREHLIDVAEILRDDPELDFKMLLDLCGVDYAQYGETQWRTEETTATGYSRACDSFTNTSHLAHKPRFAVAYQLLSLTHNYRLRLKIFLPQQHPEDHLEILSVYRLWNSANWYEREAFDLFGILFIGHPDLRRLLTDYGFIGHPFRKDFPLIGELELRYDAKTERCIYEPVSIQDRTTVPKVIRDDNRYLDPKE